MRSYLRFAIVWCVMLLLGAFARSTTLQRLSVERMTEAAGAIVRARCLSSASRWDRGEIWTFTAFEATDTWKGAPATEITVRLLGGTVGALTSHVSGVPRFRPREEVILFLEPTTLGDLTVVSWQQGTLRIKRDPRTGLEIVTQDTAAFETFDPQTRLFRATGIRDVPLETFRARVHAAVAESARRKS